MAWPAENAGMQARLAREALDGILRALQANLGSREIVSKALVVIGLMGQVRDRVSAMGLKARALGHARLSPLHALGPFIERACCPAPEPNCSAWRCRSQMLRYDVAAGGVEKR